MISVIPTILCGGSGSRLWPLSRASFPKQFLTLSGGQLDASLFQQSVLRGCQLSTGASGLDYEVKKTLVVTNEDHRFLVMDQLRELPSGLVTLLLEPTGKNTAPALTLATLFAVEQGDDPVLVVMPADQVVKDISRFIEALQRGIKVADSGSIVILGIKPTSPATGYGYIKCEGGEGGECGVERFVEKPDPVTAQAYLESGEYFWNSGIFVLKASTWISALRVFRPDIFDATQASWSGRSLDSIDGIAFIRPDKEAFLRIPGDSIDYAVIEKCPGSQFSVRMIEIDVGWNDLGAWDAVWQVGDGDANGNCITGDVVLVDTKNSLVYSSGRMVAVVGLSDVVVVETADAVLVSDRSKSQEVKQIVAMLELAGREEKNLHRKVSRPWGWYDSVDEGERFKVKRIQVKPGASLSLQMHNHRAEHWIVVKGIAEVTNGDQVIRLIANQSTYIAQGQTHRLANPGNEPLEIIEVQSGAYLGEDDIVRFEDSYGRH